VSRWVDGLVGNWIDGWMDRWMGRWVYGLTDGRMARRKADGWMDG